MNRPTRSTRIRLFLSRASIEPLARRGINVPLIRLVAGVSFRTDSDWTLPEEAIVDTGAPTCVVPERLWSNLRIRWLARGLPVKGLGRADAAPLRARLGRLVLSLQDAHHSTPALPVRAYCVEGDSVPLLIGFADVLDRMRIVCDPVSGRAWVELRR